MKGIKLNKLSPGLKKLIKKDTNKTSRSDTLSAYLLKKNKPLSAYAEKTLRHCNGGATMQAALWLKDHLKNGGKLVITLSGALSSFQIGIMLSELIRKNKVHLVSSTAGNHEGAYFRYVAHSHYAYISN